MNVADHLLDAIDRIGAPVCVGFDPVFERLPSALTASVDANDPAARLEAIRRFGDGVLEALAGVVPCVKFQSACFERYGHRGVAALEALIADARRHELVVILDAKRGDIGISAEHYAAAAFDPVGNGDAGAARADWITINAYFGSEGIDPFLEAGGGAYALVRTSNPGGDALQSQRLADGRTVAQGVAGLVASIGRGHLGDRGFSALGAVVAATTRTAEAAELREWMQQQIFLMPGYGAQGGGVESVGACVDESGHGVLVTASRSVIYPTDRHAGTWAEPVAEAAARLADAVGQAVGMR